MDFLRASNLRPTYTGTLPNYQNPSQKNNENKIQKLDQD